MSKAYVSNIPKSISKLDFESLMISFGDFKTVAFNQNKGTATVEFEEQKDCENAIANINGFEMNGNYLMVASTPSS